MRSEQTDSSWSGRVVVLVHSGFTAVCSEWPPDLQAECRQSLATHSPYHYCTSMQALRSRLPWAPY